MKRREYILTLGVVWSMLWSSRAFEETNSMYNTVSMRTLGTVEASVMEYAKRDHVGMDELKKNYENASLDYAEALLAARNMIKQDPETLSCAKRILGQSFQNAPRANLLRSHLALYGDDYGYQAMAELCDNVSISEIEGEFGLFAAFYIRIKSYRHSIVAGCAADSERVEAIDVFLSKYGDVWKKYAKEDGCSGYVVEFEVYKDNEKETARSL